jgi:ABC-type xylose transport system permease subunit
VPASWSAGRCWRRSRPQLAGETAGSAASILLAVPAALGAYLGSRQPHPLEAALLTGPRALVFLSGMLAFSGAAALALDSSVEPLRFIVGGLALASWLPVVGLALTYFLPSAPSSGDG